MQMPEKLAMAACDGDARSAVAAVTPSDLTPLYAEQKRSDAQHSMGLSLTASPSSTASSSSSLSDDGCFGSDATPPGDLAHRQQQQQHADGEFSTDALLFLLEEEQEELLLTGLDASIDLSNLDFIGDSTKDTHEDRDKLTAARSRRRQVAIAPAPCAASTSQTSRTTQHSAVPATVPSITSNGPSTSSTQTATKVTTGGRKRVKDELEYLRQHVSDLEDQLRRFKPKHPHLESKSSLLTCGGAQSSSCDSGDEQLSLVTAPPSPPQPQLVASSYKLWKRVASNQLDERRKAEAENARLRDLLEGQLRVARSLARTLRKRPNLTDLDLVRAESAQQLRLFTSTDYTAATRVIFAYLEETIDPLFQSTSSVLAEAGFSKVKREVMENRVKTDAMGRLFLEVVDSNILPFDFPTTSRGFWKFFSHSSTEGRHGICSLQAMDVTSDTLRAAYAAYAAYLPMRDTDTAQLKGHMIGRQFVEENRVVIVWSSLGKSEYKLFGSDQVVVRETGWTVIEAVPSESMGDGEASTIIQTVVRLTPDVGDLDLDTDSVSENQWSHVGVLTDLVLGSFRQNFGAMHKMVEDIVMAEMVALTT